MAEPLPLLYSFRRCPYAMRARMALLQSGLPFVVCEVSLKAKPAALLRASAKGTVPVLVSPNGQVVDESLAVMRWALEQHDPAGWLAADTPQSQALVAVCDGPFKAALDRYKYPNRFPLGERQPLHHRLLAERCLLHSLEAELRARPWLGGATACAGDVAIFPFVRQFAAVDRAWFDHSPWAATRAWLQAWLADPLFARCMER